MRDQLPNVRPETVRRFGERHFFAGIGRPAYPPVSKRLLTLDELAAYLDVSCENLLELIEKEDNAGFPGILLKSSGLCFLDEVPDWLLRLIKL